MDALLWAWAWTQALKEPEAAFVSSQQLEGRHPPFLLLELHSGNAEAFLER